MKPLDITKKISIAEKRVIELINEGSIKILSERNSSEISSFYEGKSQNRIQTAKIIFKSSKSDKDYYADYAEVVSAAYYSMYYIVHAFLALKYKKKLSEGIRGVHAITHNLVLYYLVKTKRIAKHIYEEYLKAYETASEIQKLSVEDFQEEAYSYAQKYDKTRSAREIFTYNVSSKVEEYHAEQAIRTAEEFISMIRQLMVK